MRLCFATNNKNKISEVKNKIASTKIELYSLEELNCIEELPETQTTLEGNSFEKAEYVYTNFSTPCFADDTGLEVFALNGEPGVYSARYAGPQGNNDDNIELLLKNLSSHDDRQAQFRTVITLIGLTDKPLYFEGIIKGTITTQRKGTNGFGYDAIFIPEGNTKTFAEMTMEEKNQLSHRALAVNKLVVFLTSTLA